MSRMKRALAIAATVPLGVGLSLAIGAGTASASATPDASCAAALAQQTSSYVTFQAQFHPGTTYPLIVFTAPGAHCAV